MYPKRAHQTPVYRLSSAKQARHDHVAQIQMDLEKLLSFVPGISAAVQLTIIISSKYNERGREWLISQVGGFFD